MRAVDSLPEESKNMTDPAFTVLGAPTVFQLEKARKPTSYLLASGTHHDSFVLVLADLDTARSYLNRGWFKGAVPRSFENHRDFAEFLRKLEEQGISRFGLYLDPTKAKTWPIQVIFRPSAVPFGDTSMQLPDDECTVVEIKEDHCWLMPQEDGKSAVRMPAEKHDGNILIFTNLLKHFDGPEFKFLSEPNAHVRAWFRGHADESWDLVPGVYRDDFPPKEEAARLHLERQLVRDFRVMSAGIRNGNEDEPQLYFLQQHYRMPTRLLDWTNNPLAALYFAVCSHEHKDGALIGMDAHQISKGAKYGRTDPDNCRKQVEFEGIADSRHPAFTDALRVLFWWEPPEEWPGFIMPVRPDYFDRRITLQRGCFTFHVPDPHMLTKQENPTLVSYVIPKENKQGIRKQLALLGIDDFSIFGDLDHLSTRLKEAYAIRLPR
jgi:hypothetical protein